MVDMKKRFVYAHKKEMKPRDDMPDEMMHLVYFGMAYHTSLSTRDQGSLCWHDQSTDLVLILSFFPNGMMMIQIPLT